MAQANRLPDAPGADAAWTTLRHNRALQFDFPDQFASAPIPGWLQALLKWLGAHGDWFRDAGWVVLAAFGIALLWWLFRLVTQHRPAGSVARPMPSPNWQPSPERARLLLADADALAAEGRFGEAAHLLLLVCIQEITQRRPGTVRPALTSREIAGLSILSARARAVFSQIAGVVERSLFGNRKLGADDFAQCRRAFELFTIPDNWSAAA